MRGDRHAAVHGAIRPRDDVRAMFERIVPRYDLMNRLMTGGRDIAWRRLAVREALRGRNLAAVRILDVATGTGDLALALRAAGAAEVVGLDFSAPMLDEAMRKEAVTVGDGHISWIEGDAMSLPFSDKSFDAVTVGFGLRNMPSYPAALGEMSRVLRPAGTLVCLETTPLRAANCPLTAPWSALLPPSLRGIHWSSSPRLARPHLSTSGLLQTWPSTTRG